RAAPPEAHVTCTPAGADVRDGSPATHSKREREVDAAGVAALFDYGKDAQSRDVMTASWKGSDPRGPFQASPPPPVVPAGEPVGYLLRAATRAGLLFERCLGSYQQEGCEIVWAQAGGAIHVLPYRAAMSEMSFDGETALGALPLPDGGALL